MVAANPTIRRCTIGLARAGLYGFGEPRFDAIEVLAFDTRRRSRGGAGER